MTAAVYRWFLGLSGADLLVGWAVLCILASISVYAAVEAFLRIRKRFGTWHDRVTLKHGPIKFEDRFL